MLRSILRSQRGDTLVEVLIAITVVSMVLVTAYATTTRNVDSMQDTQEHSEALQLAQTQIEYLHNVSKAGRPASGGCFNNSGTAVAHLNSGCLVDASDNPTTTQPQFTIQISNTYNAVTGLTVYSVQVTWPSLSNGINNNVTLYYQQA
jgi:prepilin-type N-terminal cleavage/methylation domain-containing protein